MLYVLGQGLRRGERPEDFRVMLIVRAFDQLSSFIEQLVAENGVRGLAGQ